MQRQIDLEITERLTRGKNAARRLRAADRVPAIVYGLGSDAQAVSLDTRSITRVLQDPAGRNSVFRLVGSGPTQHAMAVDYQVDPVKHTLLHVDLRRIDLDTPVMVSVPIASVGTAYGVKNQGGFEEMVNREVLVRCLPLDIPEHIDVDISPLHVGESIRAGDIPPSDVFELADNEHKLLLHIMASRAATATEAEELEIEESEQDV